jgi:CheY-like chemotaxis protein
MHPTFLIVDDSYIDRLVTSMQIKRTFGTESVIEVASGQAGLEWLVASGGETIVIVLDIMMPKMNGFEFLDRLERLDANIRDRCVVVMLSSTIDERDRERAQQHPNVKKLLSKPLSPNELKDVIE